VFAILCQNCQRAIDRVRPAASGSWFLDLKQLFNHSRHTVNNITRQLLIKIMKQSGNELYDEEPLAALRHNQFDGSNFSSE